jgi:hypothetical protein
VEARSKRYLGGYRWRDESTIRKKKQSGHERISHINLWQHIAIDWPESEGYLKGVATFTEERLSAVRSFLQEKDAEDMI